MGVPLALVSAILDLNREARRLISRLERMTSKRTEVKVSAGKRG